MASEHSHEKLCEAVDTVFDTILTNFDPELTTELEIEQTVYDYLVSNFELSPCDQLYVKADIGDINYLDVSNMLDSLMFYTIQEKCCKYDATNNIFLVVLITVNEDNN